MNITPRSMRYGQPASLIRDFLRREELHTFDANYISTMLQITAQEGFAVFMGLLADGYICPALAKGDTPMYGLTTQGLYFASAQFAPPISRARGEQLLHGVMARAKEIEAAGDMAFRLVQLVAFGSILLSTPVVSEVSIAIRVRQRFDSPDFERICQARMDLADARGVRFKNRAEYLAWPHLEVGRYLRGGEKYIHIHGMVELKMLGLPYRTIYSTGIGNT